MIAASDVNVGDVVEGLGRVLNIRLFQTPVASNRNGELRKGDPYYMIVAEEVKNCYDYVVDRVVFETAGSSKCYFCSDLVNVTNVSTVVFKAAA
jgi:hypothetical protein